MVNGHRYGMIPVRQPVWVFHEDAVSNAMSNAVWGGRDAKPVLAAKRHIQTPANRSANPNTSIGLADTSGNRVPQKRKREQETGNTELVKAKGRRVNEKIFMDELRENFIDCPVPTKGSPTYQGFVEPRFREENLSRFESDTLLIKPRNNKGKDELSSGDTLMLAARTIRLVNTLQSYCDLFYPDRECSQKVVWDCALQSLYPDADYTSFSDDGMKRRKTKREKAAEAVKAGAVEAERQLIEDDMVSMMFAAMKTEKAEGLVTPELDNGVNTMPRDDFHAMNTTPRGDFHAMNTTPQNYVNAGGMTGFDGSKGMIPYQPVYPVNNTFWGYGGGMQSACDVTSTLGSFDQACIGYYEGDVMNRLVPGF